MARHTAPAHRDDNVFSDGTSARWFLDDDGDFDADALEAAMRRRQAEAYAELSSIDAA